MTETIRERQLAREKDQVLGGIERYRKHKETARAADTLPGRKLVLDAVERTALAIQEMIDNVEQGKAGAGKPAAVSAYLCNLQPEAAAYITCRAVINAAVSGDRLPKTAMSIASLIEEHYQFDELRAAEPGLSNSMERKAQKWSTPRHRRFIMRLAAKVGNVRGLEWKQGDKLRLGMKLVELFITSTGLAQHVMVQEGKNRATLLRPTEATREWLERAHERLEITSPRFAPMLCPPVPWSSPISGGYLTRDNRVSFVGGVRPELRDDMFSLDMDDVYRAINAVQSTGWCINRSVYDVLVECHNQSLTIGGLPEQDDLPVPARPDDIPRDLSVDDMDEGMRARLKSYRMAATAAHDHNATLISKRLAVASQISMASDVKDEEVIYFPHNVDFRGRIYPVVPGLNPQSDDVGKSLLMFAEGKPVGESGAYWLAVHIANLFGVDKVSFDERVAWVLKHSADIMDSAANPLDGRRFWTEADDPWCALAACFEYLGYMVDGVDYVSHLPIAMDGSCSGVQHYSAMLKDREGGAAVNLLPLDQPADLYTEVANAVEVCLNDPALSTDQLAQSWRGKVTRKIVKRPCMTFAYSVTSRGMRDQILDEIRKQAGGGEYLPGWSNFESSTYLAGLVEKSIRDTVDRAAEAMDWLKTSVRALIENEMPVSWGTPDGFPVQHRYMKTTGKRFKVWFEGARMDVQLRTETTKADMRKQTSGIAPNFVHSLDAAHLRMVVNRMVDEDITHSFAMIHDSFGVHACDIDELHFAIRDEFIKLYTDDQLVIFRDHVLSSIPDADVPPTPTPGDLDLEEIRAADFFFS